VDETGALDDVVVDDVATFRLERMSDDHVWGAVYHRDGSRTDFNLHGDGLSFTHEPEVGAPPRPATAPDFTRAFIERLSHFDWLSAPEVVLEPDGDIGFDWCAAKGITISAHISATGRAGWASLINGQTTHGSFQWPDWPDALTEALRAYEDAADAALRARPVPAITVQEVGHAHPAGESPAPLPSSVPEGADHE
jgi:hypothetical protein